MTGNHIHETQPEKRTTFRNDNDFDNNLHIIQNIEGGGPIKRVSLNTLPLPLRIFGYFFFTIIVLMGAAAILIRFIR